MAIIDKPILIVGCGPGSPDFITPAASRAAKSADVLVGFPRLLDLFPNCGRERIIADTHIDRLLHRLADLRNAGRHIVILVSGDPGLHSLAHNILHHFGRSHCRLIPAVSSVQLAFARLGVDWADARITSAHGQTPATSSHDLATSNKIAILAGSRDALQWASTLATDLQSTHEIYLCENLSLPSESVRHLAPSELATLTASSLAIVLLIRRELFS